MEVTWGSNRIYLGWGGETSSGNRSIEVPFHLAQMLNLTSNLQVILFIIVIFQVDVRPVPNVIPATSITVEPISTDDWEIIVSYLDMIY